MTLKYGLVKNYHAYETSKIILYILFNSSVYSERKKMRKLFIIVILVSFLIVSCADHNSNDISKLESEVRRLADENFNLRKELIQLKASEDAYENTIEGLEGSLELAQQNQKERFEEHYKFNNDVISHLAETHKANDLIDFTGSKEVQYNSELYGETLYEEALHLGLEEFINILEEKERSVIDDVTNLLIEYINNNEIDDFKNQLKKLKYEEDTNKEYIVKKFNYWINTSTKE